MQESKTDEHHQAGHEVKDEADGALGVEADEHHALPAEAVWQGPEEEAAQAHAAEVDGGGERSQVVPVADQVPLKFN